MNKRRNDPSPLKPHITVHEPNIDRRRFLKNVALSTAALSVGPAAMTVGARHVEAKAKPMIVDTHMHVWASDKKKYPYPKDFKGPPTPATVEMLNEDMDKYGCTHSVLVQVIYHRWDNTYVADCAKRFPKRFKAHGLIDPEDPKVAEKLRQQNEALLGDQGGILWVVDATSGKKLAELKLKSLPAWDGLAAANGRLFLSTADGKIICFGE